MHRDTGRIEELRKGHWRVFVLLRTPHRCLAEDREDTVRGRLAIFSARDGRRRDHYVSTIEIGHLVGEADHDALWTGVRWDIAPNILARLQRLRSKGIEHVDTRLGGGVARRHPGFISFQR